MATDLPTAKFNALTTLTGVRTDIADMEWRWLASLVFPRVGTLDDMWAWALAADGYRDKYDMLQQVLGYKSDINTMWLDYWTNQPGAGVGAPAWTYSNAALDIDFLNDRSYFAGLAGNAFGRLTFTRNTTASYYDVNGILQFAAIDTPRIDYDPVTHEKLGFLSEQSSINYCRKSNDFTDVLWTKNNVTVTAAATTGPDGLTSATKIEATTSAATLTYNSCPNAGAAAGNTVSVFAKKGSGATDMNRFLLRNETTATDLALGTLNYDTGVLTVSSGNGSVRTLSNGWYRVQLWSLTGINANDTLRIYVGATGAGETAGEYAYFFGAQVEKPIGATSYYPADAGVATRGSDNLHLDTSAFAFNPSIGTLIGRYKSFQEMTAAGAVGGGVGIHPAGDTTFFERLTLYWYAQTPNITRMGTNGRSGDVVQWDRATIPNDRPNTFVRVGVAYQANDIAYSANGTTPIVDSSAIIPTVNRLSIGRGLHNTQYLNGHVARVTYWPTRKTNEELVALTSSEPTSTLASLFQNGGEDGFLFANFAELDEMFTAINGSNAGTIPVVANDDPVFLALDDHSWGANNLSTVIAGQTNVTPAGAWAMSVAGGTSTAVESPAGTLTLFSDGTNGARGDQQLTTVAGQVYRIDLTIATNAVSLFVGTTQGAQNIMAVSPNVGTVSYYFVATGTTTWIRLVRNAGGTTVVSGISTRLIPGNHAAQMQATANRPLWKSGSKPYLLFDGTNDSLISSFYPLVAGSPGLTFAAAFNVTAGAASNCAIGGGTPTGDKRAMLGLSGTGSLTIGWGTEIPETVPVDRRNQNLVLLVTGDGTGRDIWLNGTNVTSLFTAVSGAPDGTGGALTVGGRQNTIGGSPDRYITGNVSGALALNRRVTPGEIAYITAQLQATF